MTNDLLVLATCMVAILKHKFSAHGVLFQKVECRQVSFGCSTEVVLGGKGVVPH